MDQWACFVAHASRRHRAACQESATGRADPPRRLLRHQREGIGRPVREEWAPKLRIMSMTTEQCVHPVQMVYAELVTGSVS